MEGSRQSMNESPSPSPTGAAASSREESGWTEYLEDFMASEKREATDGCSACTDSAAAGGSSLVSDAASCVLPWKAPPTCIFEGSKGYKKLKRGAKLGDDALEDTASSPVSSPKMNDLNRFDVNPRKKEDMGDTSQEKEFAAGHLSERRGYEVNEMDLGNRTDDRVELKKKGLCLFPMSMLVDYLG